jgi:hypothetical protein
MVAGGDEQVGPAAYTKPTVPSIDANLCRMYCSKQRPNPEVGYCCGLSMIV